MDFKLVFPYVLLFFLSWGLQGFSKETQQMDFSNSLDVDALGESLADTFQQTQQHPASVVAAKTAKEGASNEGITCIQKLMPCQPFLHSLSPPPTCCTPLKELISQEICLCKIFDDPEMLKAFNLTKNEALALPKACGIKVDTFVCKNAISPGTSPTSPSTPSKLAATSPNTSPTTPSSPSKPAGSTSSNSSDSSTSSNSNASIRINNAVGASLCFNIASVSALILFSALHI